jgi:hypothetical protein
MAPMRRYYYEVDDEDVDENGVVRDGGRVHVPLMLTDSMQRDFSGRAQAPLLHRPGSLRLTDAQIEARERARDDLSARKRSAWRTPPTASEDVLELATQLAPLLGLPPPKPHAGRWSDVSDARTSVASRDGVDPRAVAYAERSRRNREAWRTQWPGAKR